MPIALVILGVSFVMLTLAIGHQLPAATVRTAVIPQVMLGQRVGHWGWMAMIVVSLTATLTTFNAGLMGSSRLIYGIARERRFFSWAARLSDRTGNPTAAILAFAGTCWCVAVVEWRTNLILEASVVAAVLYAWIYAGFVVANVRLRRLKPGAARSFRTRMPVALQGLIAAAMALFGLALLIDAEGHRAVVVLGVVAALGGSGLGASLFIRRGAPPPRFAAEASPSERGSLQ
jgi:amino acid transporter